MCEYRYPGCDVVAHNLATSCVVLTVLRFTRLFQCARLNPSGTVATLHSRKSAIPAALVFDIGHQNTHTEVPRSMNNTVTLIGYVGRHPQAKTFPDTGNKLVKFSIAVKEYSSNSDEDKTLWIDVDAWNGLGDRVLGTITKGREVIIFGRLAINTYPKEVDGIMVQMTKPVVKLSSFHLCGPKPVADGDGQPQEARANSSNRKLAAVKA